MPTLLTIPFSHFCEKARWSLDRAGVSYREEGHVPLFHRRAVQRVRGSGGSVPVLVLEGEGVVDDSPLIVKWADARAPADRKLLPLAGRDLDAALSLERHLDVDFAPHVRRLAYFHLLPDRRRTLVLMGLQTPAHEHHLVRFGFPLLRLVMQRAMRIDERGAARSRGKVRAVFEEISQRLSDGRPYLMGDRFGAVDIAFASFCAPLIPAPEHPVHGAHASMLPAGMQREVEPLLDTPAARFALRMYREHRRAAARP
jgi:glutathione S-transferase